MIRLLKKYPIYIKVLISSTITGFSNWSSFIVMLITLEKLTSNGISTWLTLIIILNLKNIHSYGYMYIRGLCWALFGFSKNLIEGSLCLMLFALVSAVAGPFE